MKNKYNTGIWIDSKQAIIVQLINGTEKVEVVNSDIEMRVREKGEKNKSSRMGKQFINSEKKDDEKLKHKLEKYYNDVIDKIKNSESILIVGPAEAKTSLQKLIKTSKAISPKIVIVDSEDKMTNNQIIAKVKNHFKSL